MMQIDPAVSSGPYLSTLLIPPTINLPMHHIPHLFSLPTRLSMKAPRARLAAMLTYILTAFILLSPFYITYKTPYSPPPLLLNPLPSSSATSQPIGQTSYGAFPHH